MVFCGSGFRGLMIMVVGKAVRMGGVGGRFRSSDVEGGGVKGGQDLWWTVRRRSGWGCKEREGKEWEKGRREKGRR